MFDHCFGMHCVNHLDKKRELVALLYILSSWCSVTVSAPWLFLTMTLVSRQCLISVFHDYAYLYISLSSFYGT